MTKLYSIFKKYLKRCICRNRTSISNEPVSKVFGLDRGTPVDRYYMTTFLKENSHFIRGVCGEFGDTQYITQLGKATTEIICFNGSDDKNCCIHLDLTNCDMDPSLEGRFDTIICTNVLNFIFDIQSASRNLMRLLKPGGRVMITTAGVSAVSLYDHSKWGDYWRLTDMALHRLFAKNKIIVKENYGNFYSCAHFLNGSAAEELNTVLLSQKDHNYFILCCIIVEKI
jgi:SAM-dependent methyltransferase